MSGPLSILRYFLLIVALIGFGFSGSAWAQSPDFVAPTFTAQTIEQRIKTLEADTALSEEQRAQAISLYRTAADRLAEATRQAERRAQYLSDIENIADQRGNLKTQIEAAQTALSATPEPIGEMIGESALFALEQDLVASEGELAAVETQLNALVDGLPVLTTRQNAAPKELAEARNALGALQTELSSFGDGELEALSDARRIALQARVWYRRNQIRALEQEIASLPLRQEILASRRTLADLQTQRLRADVRRLSERTGQRRINEVNSLRDRIEAEATAAADEHPLVASFAKRNLALVDEISVFAAQGSETSQASAAVRGRALDVENDLTAAQRLVDIGNLDREAGATLRRLGNQLQPLAQIRAQMRDTQTQLSTVTRQRIIAQENLRDLPLGGMDMDATLRSARKDMPDLPDLSPDDRILLRATLDTRRDLLGQINTTATSRVSDLADLQTAQVDLLDRTEELQTLLDENLLWVRSLPALNASFPQKVILGTAELFSPNHLQTAIEELVIQARRLWAMVVVFLLVVIATYRLRPQIKANTLAYAAKVGRVREDNAWHTPAVTLGAIVAALPLPLLFLLVGLLYAASDNLDRIVSGLADGFLNLAVFSLIFLTWLHWDREKGLFDAHFKVPAQIRRTIAVNLRWFIPLVGTTLFLLSLTSEMIATNIAEGLRVFFFILTGLALIIFVMRILWIKRAETDAPQNLENVLIKFRGLIAFIFMGLPALAIGLAATGYYESADELLSRLFTTVCVVLLTYVVYGAIRRAIVVAQRQIKYRQALERREAELQARRKRIEAEERGEEMTAPPPVDTKKIDVSTMTRQTSQLLRTGIVLGFVALLWMIWSSLVPALSIFDGFEVWSYNSGVDKDGVKISTVVSLWDLFQSVVILVLTFIAARNLPGFLEIFVLNRFGVDAGTRYAVTTVLGYLIIGIGIVIGFNQLGLQWSQLRWIATGLSVGIGFGLQKIIANFVSGLIILFERPIRIGDYVTIGDQSGTVSRIKIRATTLKNLDNLEILIPNEALISERVTNWTLTSSITRLIVPVGIAYGSDTDAARDIMLKTLKAIPKVLDTPSPQVLFMGFGDSSLDFQCRVYLRNFEERVPMTHTVHTEINRALEAAGIPIPFPQRDLNIVSQDIPLEFMSKAAPKPKRKPKPSADPESWAAEE